VREFPQLELNRLEHLPEFLEARAKRRRQLAGGLIQVDKNRCEKLPRLVMNSMGDAPGLFF
jgi:hypothetical protein